MLQTEFNFLLPKGYIDSSGEVHRAGKMRLATALDEIEAVQDPHVQTNEAYLPVALLNRVIVCLGELPAVTKPVLEGLFASDLAYLEDLYMRLNSQEQVVVSAVCPYCSGQFNMRVSPIGESTP